MGRAAGFYKSKLQTSQREAKMTQIVVPTLGESVSEATVAQWLKKEGEAVKADEPIVELETDKVTLEVNAPSDGVIVKIIVGEGQNVEVGAVLGELEAGAVANDKGSAPKAAKDAPAPAPAKAASSDEDAKTSPAVRKLLADNNLDAAQVPASGKDGRLTKEDVEAYLSKGGAKASPYAPPASAPAPAAAPSKPREIGPRSRSSCSMSARPPGSSLMRTGWAMRVR